MTFFFFSLSEKHTHLHPSGRPASCWCDVSFLCLQSSVPLIVNVTHTCVGCTAKPQSHVVTDPDVRLARAEDQIDQVFLATHAAAAVHFDTNIQFLFPHTDINLGWWVSVNQSFNLQNALWAIQLLRQKNQEKVIRATTRGS